MTLGKLRKIIDGLPDNTPIFRSGNDHSYVEATAEASTALRERGGTWTEDHGEDSTPEAEYGKRVRVVIIQ